jgi:hypothetical protein
MRDDERDVDERAVEATRETGATEGAPRAQPEDGSAKVHGDPLDDLIPRSLREGEAHEPPEGAPARGAGRGDESERR